MHIHDLRRCSPEYQWYQLCQIHAFWHRRSKPVSHPGQSRSQGVPSVPLFQIFRGKPTASCSQSKRKIRLPYSVFHKWRATSGRLYGLYIWQLPSRAAIHKGYIIVCIFMVFLISYIVQFQRRYPYYPYHAIPAV